MDNLAIKDLGLNCCNEIRYLKIQSLKDYFNSKIKHLLYTKYIILSNLRFKLLRTFQNILWQELLLFVEEDS